MICHFAVFPLIQIDCCIYLKNIYLPRAVMDVTFCQYFDMICAATANMARSHGPFRHLRGAAMQLVSSLIAAVSNNAK